MAKAAKDFKWQYSIVQDGMVYYRRVIPLAIREAHNLPRFVKKATGVSAANGAEAIAAITRLDALQQREWKQIQQGNTAKSTLEKALQFLKESRFNDLSEDEFETHDMVIRDYFRELGRKGKIPPEFALLAKMEDFRDPQTIPTVLSVALSDYLSRHRKPSDGLIYDSTSCVNKFIKLHGDIAVKEITRNMVHDYVKDRLNSKVKTTTVRRELNQLSAIVNKAFLELEMEKKSPFMSIDIPAEGKDAKEKKPITLVRLEKLLATIRNSKTTSHLIAKIQLNTGLRVSELAVAKTADVHLLDTNGEPLAIPFISITPNEFRSLKNDGSERNVPLVGLSLVAMHEAVKQAENSAYLFPQYGKKGGGTNASAAVNAALDFVDINSHDFRHFISTRMREKMIPLDVRETITGHSSKGSSELKGYGEGYKLEQMHPELLKVAIN
jgi:integrase